MDDQLKQSALDFHEFPIPGKIQVVPTKPLATQRDLLSLNLASAEEIQDHQCQILR